MKLNSASSHFFTGCLHSQPLAYLYFLAVFEHLLNQQSDLFGLLNAVSEVYFTCANAHRSSFHPTIMHNCFNSDETLINEIPVLLPFPQLHEIGSDEKTLHCIEKQALVQVIIRELAKHLLPENYKATACVSANLSDVQALQCIATVYIIVLIMYPSFSLVTFVGRICQTCKCI